MPRDSLEPVYRLITSNRYMEAIHAINKILKKQPNFSVAKIWKCEALYGLGSLVECDELMSSIIKQTPYDKRTLDSITEFYRARGNYSKLMDVYENALKDDANDEILRKSLFECCGLAGDYKKQQQQALLLYRQTPRMLFYCMAVVCLLQQAGENPVALELAERMMLKQQDEGKLKTKNEFLLLITVFERRYKYGDALDTLKKHADELESLLCVADKKVELLMKLGKWAEAIVLLKPIIEDKPDSWMHYIQYLNSVIKLEESGGTADEPFVDDSREKAETFLTLLCDKHSNLRGPFLAKLELLKMVHKELNEDVQSILICQISEYLHRFGSKAISVQDLFPYIKMLPSSSHERLYNKMRGAASSLHMLNVQQNMGYAKHLSFQQIEMYLGAYNNMSNDEILDICKGLQECFEALDSGTDRRDQYIVLQAALRKKLFQDTGDSEHLIAMVCIIEKALQQGLCVFIVQVLLLQFYFALGASKASKKIYEQLRIQSIQVDTLSHLFLLNISSTGHFGLALDMWEHALRVLQQCMGESLEALVYCYRAGLFHRVEEFTQCARRFQKSITVPFLRNEKGYLDLVMSEPSRAEQLLSRTRFSVDWDSCWDNRDINILETFDPLNQISVDSSFRELVLFCKLREAILSCVLSALVYGRNRLEDERKAVEQRIDTMKELYVEASAIKGCPNVTRLHLITKKPLVPIIEKLLEAETGSTEKVCVILKQIADDTNANIANSKPKNPFNALEEIVSQIELLSIVTVVCGAVRTGLQAPQRRRNDHIVRTIISCWNQLEPCLTMEVPQRPATCDETIRDLVEEKLRESFLSAADDMRKVIRKKTAYLHKLLNP